MEQAHTHTDIEINYLQAGSLCYLFGGRIVQLEAPTLAVFWGGIPHQTLHKSTSLRGIWATLPLSWALRHPLQETLRDQLLAGQLLQGNNLPENHDSDPHKFAEWLADFQSGQVFRRELASQEINCRLARLSHAHRSLTGSANKHRPHPRSKPADSPVLVRLQTITTFLGKHYQSPLTVEGIARQISVHPKSLLRLFQTHCGISLWNYVIQLRLAHAQRLLLTTNRTIIDIALESGFGSQAAFYHAFRRQSPHLSPSEFRRQRI